MKRGILAIGLGVVLLAAILVIGKLGLFRRPSPTPIQMPTPPAYGGAGLFGPPRALSQSEAYTLLDKWTYPGAKAQADLPPPLPRGSGAPAVGWKTVLLRFTVHGPGSRVRRFYAKKIGVNPKAGAGSRGSAFRHGADEYLHKVMSRVMVSSPEIKEAGEFTYLSPDYMISAIYAVRPKRKQTQVEVLLIAYGGMQPAAASAPHAVSQPS